MNIKELISRGHTVGGGVVSPDRQWFVLTMPKNASTYTTNTLLLNGWEHWNLANGTFRNVIVPLRDPVDRWVSGTATYCCSYVLGNDYGGDHFCDDYNDLVERLLVDTMFFDDHTVPQSTYVDFIPDCYEKKFVLVKKETFFPQLSEITGTQIVEHKGVYDNSKDTNSDNLKISNLLRSRLNASIINRIKVRYQKDYELLEFLNGTR